MAPPYSAHTKHSSWAIFLNAILRLRCAKSRVLFNCALFRDLRVGDASCVLFILALGVGQDCAAPFVVNIIRFLRFTDTLLAGLSVSIGEYFL